MKTIKVFIASSEELKLERLEFTDMLQQLNRILKPRGLEIEPVKWEYLDASMGPVHKQDQPDTKSQPLVRANARHRRQRHHDIQNQRQRINNEHSHERPTFRTMPTSATTRATGISIHRFKLASDAWW